MKEENGDLPLPPAIERNDKSAEMGFLKLPFPIRELPMLNPDRVRSFEEAREVFLRAATKIEIAKRDFPMDGV